MKYISTSINAVETGVVYDKSRISKLSNDTEFIPFSFLSPVSICISLSRLDMNVTGLSHSSYTIIVNSPEAVTNVLASSFGRILTRKFNFHVGLFNMIFHYMQDGYRGRWEQQKSISHQLAEVGLVGLSY